MSITLDEILIQLALGTLDPTIYPEIYHITDQRILALLAFCDDVSLRRAAASNPNTPFRAHYKQYTEDIDFMVRECAWEHTRLRYIRMFHKEPPKPSWRKAIDPYNL
jgi:hypothetical protein